MARTKRTSRLPKISREMERNARAVVKRTGLRVEAKTKSGLVEMGAVDTGNLLNSYQTHEAGALRVEVGTPVEYAEHIEYGTTAMAPRPALTLAGTDKQIRKQFEAELKALVK